MKETFKTIVNENITRPGIDSLMRWLEEESDFYTAPASTHYHGAYEGGLLEHSLHVYKNLIESPHLKDYSKESLAIVSLFHDICKANLYKIDFRNVKNENGQWEKVPYYTHDETLPMGHGEKSVYLVTKHMPLSDEEALAINWHMGGFDQRVKGGSYDLGNAYGKSLLAFELHIADMRATYVDETER